MATIESLQLEISANSSKAVSGIAALTQSLEKLKSTTSGGLGLASISKNLTSIAGAARLIDSTSISNVTGLANAVRLLGNTKISTSIANQITAISTSLQGANFSGGREKMEGLVDALSPLSDLGKTNLSSYVSNIKKLPEVFEKLSKIDMSSFRTKIQEIATALKPLGDEMQKVSNGFSAFPDKIQKMLSATDKVPSANAKATQSFSDLYTKAKLVIHIVQKVTRAIWSTIQASSDYTETLNLFNVAMGEYASSAKGYADTVSEIMGINPEEWMKNQGVFMTMATGFGIAGDRAAKMSEQLTQLTYDISSFYNMSSEEAFLKLKSGLAGELEPLRAIGYDLSQAKLEATALELGIDKAVSSMTQAEKAQLRYYAIMTQVTTTHGDMARTLDQPANQLRVLKAQLEMAAKSIGDIFIPALQAILPYAIAVVKVVREIADGLASLVNPGGESDPSEALEKASEAADSTSAALDEGAENAKKLKSYMLGFDELNVINPNTDSAEDSSGAFDFELPEYDFLSGATNEKIEGIKTQIQELIQPIRDLINLTVEWAKELDLEPISKGFKEIGDSLSPVLSQIGDVFGWVYEEVLLPIAKWAIEAGLPAIFDAIAKALEMVGKVIAPIIEGIKELKPVLEPIVSWINDSTVEVFNGLGSVFEKLGNTFEEKGGTIKDIIKGIGDIISVVWGWIKPILDKIQTSKMFETIGNDLSAIVKVIIDVVGGIVEFLTGVFTGDWDRAWDGICGIFEGVWEFIKYSASSAWESISNIFSPVAIWFNEKVVQPIVNFFAPIVERISGFFEGSWIIIKAVWMLASTWINDKFITPIKTRFEWLTNEISNRFAIAKEYITTKLEPFVTAFENVTGRIADFFAGLWLGIKKGAVGAMNIVIDKIEGGINGIISLFNDFLKGFNKIVEWAANLIGEDWGGVKLVNEVSFKRIPIPTYADGGFPEQGQMFIANEAGAEMVGSIGRRTAVANNDQIVASVAGGVAEANEEQNALLREQNSLLRELLNKDNSVYLDGKPLTNSVEKYQRERGRVLITGGVI